MGRAEEVIIEALREGPKTAKELRHECITKQGIVGSTYNRQLRKLIKLGEVKEAKYELIEKEKEADPEIIRDCIKIIRSDKPDKIRVARAKQLNRLCYWKRTAYAPDLLNFLKTSFNDKNEKVRKHLVLALANLLLYEQRRKPRDVHIIHRIIDDNIENLRKLTLKERNHEVRVAVLKFLGYTGDVRALDPIFEIIKSSSEEEYEKLKEWIQWVLFTPEYLLTKKLRRDVSKRIDKLFTDPNEKVRKRAKELHEYMLSPNGMQQTSKYNFLVFSLFSTSIPSVY